MLKIKDDVDLKELEKLGFELRYSEYTGKPSYYLIYIKSTKYDYNYKVLMNVRIDKRNINIYGDIELLLNETMLKIFELTSLGLIEKVGD